MNKLVIFTDASCDLPHDEFKKRDIKLLPLYVCFGDKSYLGRIDINDHEIYDMIEKTGILPHTQSLPPDVMLKYFCPYIEKGYDVLYIGISSGISSTMQNAFLAQRQYPDKIHLVDSWNMTSGLGLLTLHACDMRDNGKSVNEIMTELNKLKENTVTTFVVKQLTYLRKGGRVSNIAAMVGAALRVRPYLKMIDGKLVVYKKIFGKYNKGLEAIFDEFYDEYKKGNVYTNRVFITAANDSKAQEYFKTKLKENNVKIDEVIICEATPIIATHCGPGTCGLLYITKNRSKYHYINK